MTLQTHFLLSFYKHTLTYKINLSFKTINFNPSYQLSVYIVI